jgi:hypothetical protein
MPDAKLLEATPMWVFGPIYRRKSNPPDASSTTSADPSTVETGTHAASLAAAGSADGSASSQVHAAGTTAQQAEADAAAGGHGHQSQALLLAADPAAGATLGDVALDLL